jgi:hypothetical protein
VLNLCILVSGNLTKQLRFTKYVMRFIVFLSLFFSVATAIAKECESKSISDTFDRLANLVVEKQLSNGKYLIRVNAPKKIEMATFDFIGYGLESGGEEVLTLDLVVSEVDNTYQSHVAITKDILSRSSFSVMYSLKPNSPGTCTYTYWMPNNIIVKSTTSE